MINKVELSFVIGDEVIDIPTMASMPDSEYANYIEEHLLWVDHHDILRATLGDYPIATSSSQIKILIEHLQRVAAQMKAAGRG